MGNKLNQDIKEEKIDQNELEELEELDEDLTKLLHNHIDTIFSNPISMINFCWKLAKGRFKMFGKGVQNLAKEILGLMTEGGDIDK
jgi:hypothetical protein